VNWKYFAGSVILAAALMLRAGAPVETVAAGVALAALINVARRKWPRTSAIKGKVQR